MSYPRQQRGANVRGRVQIPNQRPTPDASWIPQTIVGTDLIIDIDPLTGPWSLDGIPQVESELEPMYPTSAALAGNQLTLTYPSALDPATFFKLRSADPAVRGPLGAFLSAFRGQYNSLSVLPYTPGVVTATYSSHLLNDIVFDLSPAVGTAMFGVFGQIVNETTPATTAGAIITNANLTAQMTGPVNSGETISYGEFLMRTDLAGAYRLGQFSIVVP